MTGGLDISALTGSLGNLGGLMDIGGFMSSFSFGSSESADALVSNTQPAPGYNRTVNRSTVDAAVARIIGNPKVPTPSFGADSLPDQATNTDINYAKTILSNTQPSALSDQLNSVAQAQANSGDIQPLTQEQQQIQALGARLNQG